MMSVGHILAHSLGARWTREQFWIRSARNTFAHNHSLGEWWEKRAGGAADAANFFPQDAESNQKGDWYNLEKCVKACLNMRGQLLPKWLDGSSTETTPNFGIAWVELSWEFHYKRRKTCSTHTRRLTISTSKDTELRPPSQPKTFMASRSEPVRCPLRQQLWETMHTV